MGRRCWAGGRATAGSQIVEWLIEIGALRGVQLCLLAFIFWFLINAPFP